MAIRQTPPFRIIAENAKAYRAANVAVYGTLLAGFGVGLAFPKLSQAQHRRLQDDGTADLVQSLIANPWLFALTILAVNTLKMGALTIVAPSLIVPFAGIAFFAYWALATGMTLVPAQDIGWVALIPHSLTVIVELQPTCCCCWVSICSARAGSHPGPSAPKIAAKATFEGCGTSAG
ncbi:hypothetical protein [Mycobacterium sp. DL592]|uniref:hypothetical protein n=1 Tax=Mycobacterium sp. DL592 TaxID=2675524 RepID=UPI001AAFB998|nr:hypothetical protein [Mycobacterium sp. DL592]